MKWLGATLAGLMIFAGANSALAQKPSAADAAADAAAIDAAAPPPPPKSITMDALLERVKAGWNGERKENRDREAAFAKAKADQERLLNEANVTREALERRSEQLERQFEENELSLTQLEETLTQRLGSLGELFGVVRQVAGDTRSQLEGSLASAQIPGREDFLEELGKNKSLPSIESLDENSDYSPFFSPGVSEDLRRVALRKLFRSASFNELCPLEGEYHDCRGYEALGSVVTHEMRSQLEREAAELAKRAQAAVEETIKETMESPPTHSPSGGQPSPAPGLRAGSKPERTGQTAARKATRPTSARAKRKRSERC